MYLFGLVRDPQDLTWIEVFLFCVFIFQLFSLKIDLFFCLLMFCTFRLSPFSLSLSLFLILARTFAEKFKNQRGVVEVSDGEESSSFMESVGGKVSPSEDYLPISYKRYIRLFKCSREKVTTFLKKKLFSECLCDDFFVGIFGCGTNFRFHSNRFDM